MFGKLFGRGDKTPRQVTLQPTGRSFEVPGNEAILDAALREGIAFPNKCRAGVCGSCKCRVVEGEVKELTDSSYTLSGEELQSGYVLACQSVPRSDLTIELPASTVLDQAPAVRTVLGEIAAVRRVSGDIVELDVKLEEPLVYRPGQYADLTVPGVLEEPRSFSFANAPGADGSDFVQFHVRHVAGGRLTSWIMTEAAPGQRVRLEGPFGDFHVRPSDRPMLCIAGGTGFAPIKAMLDELAEAGEQREVALFYGTRTQQDLYCADYVEGIGGRWRGRFEFHPVLSEEDADSGWSGLRGLVTAPIEARPDWASYDCYLCGPPAMIDAAMAILKRAGVPPERIHYDKFLDRSHLAEAQANIG